MTQCILPVVHDLIPAAQYDLVRAIRVLACICMYADMRVQTQGRIEAGKGLVLKFGQLIEVRA